jgi:hypothetical protein
VPSRVSSARTTSRTRAGAFHNTPQRPEHQPPEHQQQAAEQRSGEDQHEQRDQLGIYSSSTGAASFEQLEPGREQHEQQRAASSISAAAVESSRTSRERQEQLRAPASTTVLNDAALLRSVGASSEVLANGMPEKARGGCRAPCAEDNGFSPPPWFTEGGVELSTGLSRMWASMMAQSMLAEGRSEKAGEGPGGPSAGATDVANRVCTISNFASDIHQPNDTASPKPLTAGEASPEGGDCRHQCVREGTTVAATTSALSQKEETESQKAEVLCSNQCLREGGNSLGASEGARMQPPVSTPLSPHPEPHRATQ